MIKLRRFFHQYPELSLKEVKTSAYITEYLKNLGYEITQVPPTGLWADLPAHKEKEKKVVLRAEMDGLPIQEKTGLPYASLHEGCMHACGHDAILAVALVMAKIAAEEGADFPVGIRFLFEPAEETGEGARRMVEAGALDDPKTDAFLMFHFAGDQSLGMAVHEGQASAMIGGMQIHIHGKSSHWCEAHKGIDSIYAASLVIGAVHDLNVSYQGQAPCLVGIGSVHGGEYSNIIADHVVLGGNIRACREADYNRLKEELEIAFGGIERKTGTRIEMVFPKEPVLSFENDSALTRLAADAGRKVFGDRFFLEGEDELFLSGDNAYRYFQRTRGVFPVFLAGIPGEDHPLHHPEFQLDERILPLSLEALYEIIHSIGK